MTLGMILGGWFFPPPTFSACYAKVEGQGRTTIEELNRRKLKTNSRKGSRMSRDHVLHTMCRRTSFEALPAVRVIQKVPDKDDPSAVWNVVWRSTKGVLGCVPAEICYSWPPHGRCGHLTKHTKVLRNFPPLSDFLTHTANAEEKRKANLKSGSSRLYGKSKVAHTSISDLDNA